MQATCVNSHESDLGEVPMDVGVVKWECPQCQAVGNVPGTEPLPVQAPTTEGEQVVATDQGSAVQQ